MKLRMLGFMPLWILPIGLPLGCTATMRSEQATLGERVDEDAFLNEHLPRQPVVTVAEACRAVLILADGRDFPGDSAARMQELVSRGIVRREWDLQGEAAIDKGTVAWMICRTVNLPGGVNYTLLGSWGPGDRRYALRELQYRQWMAPAAPYQYITGGELVDLLAKADRYMAEKGRYREEPVDLTRELAGVEARTDRPAASHRP